MMTMTAMGQHVLAMGRLLASEMSAKVSECFTATVLASKETKLSHGSYYPCPRLEAGLG